MKKTIVILFSVFLTGIGFYGCKKGENDPFISFKSRDKRLMGEWTLSKMDLSSVTVNKGNTIGTSSYNHKTISVTTSFDGSILTKSTKTDDTYYPTPPPSTITSQTITDRSSTTITLTLDKHGVAKSTETSTYISTTRLTTPTDACMTGDIAGIDCDGTYTNTGTALLTSSTNDGKWGWMDDNKNKEQVFIEISGTMGGIYMIDQLKNKEIILKENSVIGLANSGASNDSYNLTSTGDYTLTAK